jgi:hypothetical protein
MAPLARSDTKTLFHIDTEWFERTGRDLREEMHNAICDECRALYPTPADARVVDRVNPKTAEITRMDSLWECLADHCGHLPGFITPVMPLTAAMFRAFLANNNKPLTPEQLHKRIGKSNAVAILRVLMGAEIENGVVAVEAEKAPKV